MIRQVILIELLLIGLLASCGVDPRNIADADRTRLLAAEQAANLKSDREAKQNETQQAARERELTEAARVAAWNRFYLCASIAACAFVIALAAGAAWAALASGQAAGKAAAVKAYLIPLPEQTRQYPLIISYLSRGKFSLSNPNNGSVMLLDSRQPCDRDVLMSSGAVQLAGMIGREARLGSKRGELDLIPSEVRHAQQ
jgi:hypothetical protein